MNDHLSGPIRKLVAEPGWPLVPYVGKDTHGLWLACTTAWEEDREQIQWTPHTSGCLKVKSSLSAEHKLTR